MIATTILLGRALAPVEQLVAGWPTLLEGRAAWQRLSDLLANVVNPVPSVRLPAPTGRVSLQEVAFQPDADERPVLSGVSFEVEPGGSLAIIGPSGSGKSTLARLVVGVWHPTSGKVRLDRVDLAQWPRKQVGPSIGYVPQAIQLFAGTVAENIARLDAVDSKRVVEAAKRAHVHDLIVGLPQGYETRIDPQSPIVSPGQRPRIAHARVLESLRGTVTVVVVTHRPQLVQHVDRMLVLEHGQVKRIGNVLEVTAAMAPSGARPGAAVLPVARLGRAAGGAR
jgi:ABC-type protease/lipase transport system fused ATPase/permease subunit